MHGDDRRSAAFLETLPFAPATGNRGAAAKVPCRRNGRRPRGTNLSHLNPVSDDAAQSLDPRFRSRVLTRPGPGDIGAGASAPREIAAGRFDATAVDATSGPVHAGNACPEAGRGMEREKGIEPSTLTLAT